MPHQEDRTSLCVDASVLVDFVNVDRTVLALVGAHVGALFVPSPVLAEVDGLDAAECHGLGVHVLEPTPAQLAEAAGQAGALSFQDRLCLVVARDSAMTCVTNDGALLKACERLGLPTMRGLRLLLELVRGAHLDSAAATSLAERMASTNPLHLNSRVLSAFRNDLTALPHSSGLETSPLGRAGTASTPPPLDDLR